jgi:hypothetical protein
MLAIVANCNSNSLFQVTNQDAKVLQLVQNLLIKNCVPPPKPTPTPQPMPLPAPVLKPKPIVTYYGASLDSAIFKVLKSHVAAVLN